MRSKTIYIAHDGKEFNSQYDCEVYENNLIFESEGIEKIMLDKNFKITRSGDSAVFLFFKESKNYYYKGRYGTYLNLIEEIEEERLVIEHYNNEIEHYHAMLKDSENIKEKNEIKLQFLKEGRR